MSLRDVVAKNLVEHYPTDGWRPTDVECACGETCDTFHDFRLHQADAVLDVIYASRADDRVDRPMTPIRCDARTRHVSRQYVIHVISEVRAALLDILAGRYTERAVTDIRRSLTSLENMAARGRYTECGWTGWVENPASWTCPACRTWHTTDKGQMNR